MSEFWCGVWDISNSENYISQEHDVRGVIRLLKLQLEINASKDENVIELIQRSKNTNPYTGKAMDYDEEKRILSFKCLDYRKFKKCSISI